MSTNTDKYMPEIEECNDPDILRAASEYGKNAKSLLYPYLNSQLPRTVKVRGLHQSRKTETKATVD